MSKRREELRKKVARGQNRGQSRRNGEHVPGPSTNPETNLIMANAIVRTGSILFRQAVEKRMLKDRYGKETARSIVENKSMGSTLFSLALSRIASRSSTGAIAVGGGMIAKTLYDRRRAKKAQAKGDAHLLEDATED